MNIIPHGGSNSLLEALMHGDRDILISYEDKRALQQFLKRLDIDLVSEPQFDETAGVVTIRPRSVSTQYEYRSVPDDFIKKLKNYKKHNILIPDFRNSEAFYLECAQSKFKIITDEYSIARSTTLYEYIGKIEKNLRVAYVKKFGSVSIDKKLTSYRRDAPDHIIAQLDLNDIISHELLKPSDERIFLDQIAKAKNTSEILAARNRKRIDDLDFGLSVEDFEEFRKVRNAVMHFRVVRTGEMKSMLDISSRFDLKEFEKIFKI